MNVDIDARDNYPFVAIMAFPNKRLSFFDVEKLLKAQNTVSWNTPEMTAKCALASDAFKRVVHIRYPGRNKAAAMVESLPALTKRYWSLLQFPNKEPTNVSGLSQLGHCNGLMPIYSV